METGKIYFKEERYYKKKFIRLLLLFAGEIIVGILLFIISQLLKSNGASGIPVQNYVFAVVFMAALIIAILFTWGAYVMQNMVQVNQSGISQIFKMPPLIKREKKLSKNAVKKIYWASSKKVVYENGQFRPEMANMKKEEPETAGRSQIVFETYDSGTVEFKTSSPMQLEQALSKMFKRKGS